MFLALKWVKLLLSPRSQRGVDIMKNPSVNAPSGACARGDRLAVPRSQNCVLKRCSDRCRYGRLAAPLPPSLDHVILAPLDR
jgi:hypothetical protein